MAPNFNDPDMQEIFEGFLIETRELLDSLSHDLVDLENQGEDMDLLNRVFRSFHTIKGTSSFMGFDDIAGITHHAEDILNKMRRSELKVSLPIVDVLLEVHDWIEDLLTKIQEGDDSPVDFSDTISKIEALRNPKPIQSDSDSIDIKENIDDYESEAKSELEAHTALETQTISEDDYEEHAEEYDSIDEFSDNTEDLDTQDIEQSLDNQQEYKSAVESVLTNDDLVSKPGDFTDEELQLIQDAFAELNSEFVKEIKNVPETKNEDIQASSQISVSQESPSPVLDSKQDIHNIDKNENASTAISESIPKQEKPPTQKPEPSDIKKQAPQSAKKPQTAAETIRVDVGRVETLMDLSGELVLGRNRLAQLAETLALEFEDKSKVRDLIETTAQIDFVTSEIQAAVMRMRMVPVGKLYQKAPRIVRDLSKEFGKRMNLVVKGEETEIDRGIIEELNDPLVHMIRNSCDHGIEDPETRTALGKPAIGTITLDAEQEGNAIVLKISDDGKGMDPEKLKAKAIEKGVISEETASQMTRREILQLIFQPGFSTAVKVSSVSGRGVGMDVVRTNIMKLKGIIDIESEVGKGSTFIIKLPLTLAIIQGLLVKVQHETYAIPLSNVVEVVAVDIQSIKSINQQEVVRLRNEVHPLLRLDKTLSTPTINEKLKDRYIVVVGIGLQRIGLVVDELLGQQEIVIKSLGKYLGHIYGIAGSTILGDGSVIMIIDVAELVQMAYNQKNIV